MRTDDRVRLGTVADMIAGAHTRAIELREWQEPKHARLLKSPLAFVDDVVRELSDDGKFGDALPWPKTWSLYRERPHEVSIWAGANGDGKSTVTSEIAVYSAGVIKRHCVVISLEVPAAKVAARMAVQAFANRVPVRSAVLAWAEELSARLTFLDLTGDLSAIEVIKLVRYCAHELQAEHVTIDNLTKIVSADNDHADDQRRFMAQLHRAAIDTGIHINLVAHTRKPPYDEKRPPGRYDIAGSRTLSDQPDNVIMVWRNRPKEAAIERGDLAQGKVPDLFLRVDKQRHGSFEGQIGLWMRRDCFRFVGDWADDVYPYFAH